MNFHARPQTSNLGRVAKQGIAWILTARGVVFLITLGASIILARLLDPRDFGIYGIAQIFTGFTTRFGNFGFGQALIQRKEIRDGHVSSLFVFNLLLFFSLAGLLIFISPFIGTLFQNPLAGRVLAVMALMFLLSPFSSVARVLMQRGMDFRGAALSNMVDHIISSIIAIILALKGFGVWSLVYGYICGSLFGTIILMYFSKWKPKILYNHRYMKDLFSFGLNMFLKRMLIYGSDKMDYIVIGKQLGPASLGFYEKAFNLMEITVKELSVKIGPVLFSAFSKIQEDRARLVTAYHKVTLTLSLIAYPVFFGLGVVAPVFVHVLYGEKWMSSVVPLQIMCVAGLMRIHLRVTSTVVNAIGKIAGDVWRRAVAFVLLAFGCLFGSYWGIVGVSLAVTIVTASLAITMTSYLGKLTGLTWADFIRPQRPALMASVCMTIGVLFYQRYTASILGTYSVAMLFSSVAIGAIVYGVALWILRPAAVVSLLQELMADVRPVAGGTTR